MEKEEYARLTMLTQEAFIRRAAAVDHPFMLKGSFVTRQYFPKEIVRIPRDLDWVYLHPLHDEPKVRKTFDDWMLAITEHKANDGIEFRSFTLNQFWRRIDYAMSDDFPTVSTDVLCWIEGEEIELTIDVSFNLDVESPPVPLSYQPVNGEAYIVPRTVPLSLQVSWKIHQTLVRPRFKDLFDLLYLVQHKDFTNETLALTLQALVNECKADKIDTKRIAYFMAFEIERFFPNDSFYLTWDYWRHLSEKWSGILNYDRAGNITDVSKLPKPLTVFLSEFRHAMEKAGFGPHLMDHLPKPIYKPRIQLEGPMVEVNNQKRIEDRQNDNPIPETEENTNKGILSFIKTLFGK